MEVEGLLVNCMAIHAAENEDSPSSVHWNLASTNEHCFRLHLERNPLFSAAASSSSEPASWTLIELDVSLPVGFSEGSHMRDPAQSFLATLPGSASHHALDLNASHSGLLGEMKGQAAASGHPSQVQGLQRVRQFSESDWERVQDALQHLNERLDKVAADEAARAEKCDPESHQMHCVLAVLGQVDQFGKQVVGILDKKKGSPTMHEQFREKRRQLEDWRDGPAALDSDDDMDEEPGWGGEAGSGLVPLHLLAVQAEASCDSARKAFQAASSFSSVTPARRSAMLASSHEELVQSPLLLCWCSVAVYSESQAVLLCLDIHSLAAGHLNAVEGLGLSRKHPLLMVLLRFAGSVWRSWKPDDAGQAGLSAKKKNKQSEDTERLPRPEEIWVFQADSVEEAQEHLERSLRFGHLDRMVRGEVPLEWWGTIVPKKPHSEPEPDPESEDETAKGEDGDEMEIDVGTIQGGKIDWDTWVALVTQSDKVPKGSKKLCREALERTVRKAQLVVQDQVKENQRRALEKTIPGILEAWFAVGAKAESSGGASGAQEGGAFHVQARARATKLKDPIRLGQGGSNGNGLLCLLLHVANELRSLHRLCPSCSQHLPVASTRLRSCPNPLCLYTSEELGPNMSILSELITSVDVADLQLDLAAAAADALGRDVFEPFPSFLLKGKDQERGRAGWFEKARPTSGDATASLAALQRRTRLAQAPGSGSSRSLANKDMEIIRELIKAVPRLEPLMKSTSAESSLKLQLSAVWLWRRIRFLPPSSLQNGQELPAMQPFQLYDFLRFVLFTNRLALMPLHGTPHAFVPDPGFLHQFMVLNESPEREQYYRQKKAELGGTSYFAFHGSRACNWFSILRNGLRSMSRTEYMSAGASYGEGIYLSPDAHLSLGYSQAMSGRATSLFGAGFQCMAICEVLGNPDSSSKGQSIIVVPTEETANVFVRYLLVFTSRYQDIGNWRISGGTLLEIPKVGSITLSQHMQQANDTHVRQLQVEKERVWAERIGLARLAQRRSAVVVPARSTGSDDGIYAQNDSEEDEQFEYSDGSDNNEDQWEDDVIEVDAKAWQAAAAPRVSGSPSRKAAGTSGTQPAVGPPFGAHAARAGGPSAKGSSASAPGYTPGLPNASASDRAKATAPSSPAPRATDNGAFPAPKPYGPSKARSQTAQKAVQMELRKVSNLQAKGNDTLPTGSFELDLPDESDVFCWRVRLKPVVFKDSTLEPDLRRAAAMQHVAEVPVTLEILFPDDFPFQPPFVRVVSPRFLFHTGHITVGGSICMELLTASGWSPAYTVEAVIVQIVAEMCHGEARLDTWYMDKAGSSGEYSMHEAKSAFTRVAAAHGWKT